MIMTHHFDFDLRIWPISALVSKTLLQSQIQCLALSSVICFHKVRLVSFSKQYDHCLWVAKKSVCLVQLDRPTKLPTSFQEKGPRSFLRDSINSTDCFWVNVRRFLWFWGHLRPLRRTRLCWFVRKVNVDARLNVGIRIRCHYLFFSWLYLGLDWSEFQLQVFASNVSNCIDLFCHKSVLKKLSSSKLEQNNTWCCLKVIRRRKNRHLYINR